MASPVVMGILNITPDSFYSGSRTTDRQVATHKVAEMLRDGAQMIDLGAQSSRPGADRLTAQEEWERLRNVVPYLTQTFPDALFSIDTFYGSVAQQAIDAGVALVNDISAGALDPTIWEVVAQNQVPYIIMHMQGDPQTMQLSPKYEDVTAEVVLELSEKVARLRAKGISDIIVDPGFGFGKTIQHNYQLLKNLHQLQVLGCAVLAGVSRKSMIYKVLDVQPEEALNGTTAVHMVALQQGAKILRVHDVKPAVEVVKLYSQIQNA